MYIREVVEVHQGELQVPRLEYHEEWDLAPEDIAAGQAEARIAALKVNLGASAANLMEEVAGSEASWAGGATGAQ
jgi:hypothetical protein